MPTPRYAFTLLELLVVISIIAVLAALLMPALGLMKAAAAGVRCGNSLRQFAIADLTYADAWDQQIVPRFINDAAGVRITPQGLWFANPDFVAALDSVDPVPCVPRRMFCSAARPPATWSAPSQLGLVYGMNYDLVPTSAVPFFVATLPLARVSHQSEVIFAADGIDWQIARVNVGLYNGGEGQAATGAYQLAIAFRHRGRANASHLDGHLESLTLADLGSANRWNP